MYPHPFISPHQLDVIEMAVSDIYYRKTLRGRGGELYSDFSDRCCDGDDDHTASSINGDDYDDEFGCIEAESVNAIIR